MNDVLTSKQSSISMSNQDVLLSELEKSFANDFVLSDPRENIAFFNGKFIGRGNVYLMDQSKSYSEKAVELLDSEHSVQKIFS